MSKFSSSRTPFSQGTPKKKELASTGKRSPWSGTEQAGAGTGAAGAGLGGAGLGGVGVVPLVVPYGGVGAGGVSYGDNGAPVSEDGTWGDEQNGWVEEPRKHRAQYAPMATGETKAKVEEDIKVKTKEEVTVTVTEEGGKGKCNKKDGGWGGRHIMWAIVIFIFILFLVLIAFWAVKPECVSRKCEETGNVELDPWRAGGYAFGIAFFFLIIILVAYCCWCR